MRTYDPHKTTTEVRQGNRRLLNFRVMIISLTVVNILFALIYLGSFVLNPPTAN